MNKVSALLAAVALSGLSVVAQAAVSAEEVAQLGQTLTRVGAQKAGNADSTIPEYSGGLQEPPPEYKAGSGIYVDPYKDEKPLFTITAQNYKDHSDKLAEGVKELFRRYPDYRMNVYPSHRSVAFPDHVLEATSRNATKTTLADGGLTIQNVEGGVPFPIPKNGQEAMWNHLIRWSAEAITTKLTTYYVDQSGRRILTALADFQIEYPLFQGVRRQLKDFYFAVTTNIHAPTALAGQQIQFMDRMDQSRQAYLYIPAQRRVKLAPEFAYDTPNPASAGTVGFDDLSIFNGKLDRFTWKLVGKKEVYLPYNEYKLNLAKMEERGTPKFINPDLQRWELHRVWVVEGELKQGERHWYKKRVLYWDEDGFGAGMADNYDAAGKLFRASFSHSFPLYDAKGLFLESYTFYDFSSGLYVDTNATEGRPVLVAPNAKIFKAADWSPEAMAGRALR